MRKKRLLGNLLIAVLSFAPALGQIRKQRPPTVPATGSLSPRQIAKNAFPSVVVVVTEDAARKPIALGTGFFVGDQIVATNYHVMVQLQPNRAYAHYSIGLCYLVLEDKNSAFEEYKILKKLDDKLARSLFDLIYK